MQLERDRPLVVSIQELATLAGIMIARHHQPPSCPTSQPTIFDRTFKLKRLKPPNRFHRYDVLFTTPICLLLNSPRNHLFLILSLESPFRFVGVRNGGTRIFCFSLPYWVVSCEACLNVRDFCVCCR